MCTGSNHNLLVACVLCSVHCCCCFVVAAACFLSLTTVLVKRGFSVFSGSSRRRRGNEGGSKSNLSRVVRGVWKKEERENERMRQI